MYETTTSASILTPETGVTVLNVVGEAEEDDTGADI